MDALARRIGGRVSLHPLGALRARFSDSGPVGVFRRLGVGAQRCDLGDQGLYLAEELVGADRWLAGSDPEALGILVLALMIAQRQGSTRLSLDPKGKLRALVGDILRVAELDVDAAKIVKRIHALTSAPGFQSVIGSGTDRRPLVVEDGCIYTERARWLEQRVANRLAARLAPLTRDGVTGALADLAARPAVRPLSAEQSRAVELAVQGRLAIVTGGPGTGKTVVATAIVRAFARLGMRAERIALAAPTGKAANRLAEVIARELAGIAEPSDIDRALVASPPQALTLHRLLGYRGNGFARAPRGAAPRRAIFDAGARCPLPIDALIVDEASMIDLELVDALLDALPERAALVLIGDAHQLPAIDAGQILADLAEPGPASPRVVRLEHSFRMDTQDPGGRAVLAAARAVHAGDVHRLVERTAPPSGGAAHRAEGPVRERGEPLAVARTPGTLAFSGVEWVEASADAARQVAAAVWHHFDGPRAQRLANDTVFRFEGGRVVAAQQAELERLWQLVGRARILAVTRGLASGAHALNAYLHDLALDRMTVAGRPDFVPGEPVMITANDYQRGLYNGDQGIVVRADEGLEHHRYRAVFRVGGQLVPFAIEALRDRLELAWALTVHKSQGSELDAVALVLPDEDLPLVTRELLYTGITRARTSVVLCGPRATLLAAGKRRALRDSGLAARIAVALVAPTTTATAP
jgi:exodeoxyribonuclease V alpha subunit